MSTVTVTCSKPAPIGAYQRCLTLSFSRLPEQSFGPYDMIEAMKDLTVSALLGAIEARDLVFNAIVQGSATTGTNE